MEATGRTPPIPATVVTVAEGSPAVGAVVTVHWQRALPAASLRAFSTWSRLWSLSAWRLYWQPASPSCSLRLQMEAPLASLSSRGTNVCERTLPLLRNLRTHLSQQGLIQGEWLVQASLGLENEPAARIS